MHDNIRNCNLKVEFQGTFIERNGYFCLFYDILAAILDFWPPFFFYILESQSWVLVPSMEDIVNLAYFFFFFCI